MSQVRSGAAVTALLSPKKEKKKELRILFPFLFYTVSLQALNAQTPNMEPSS
jgi:hypothetical protein